MLKPATAPVLEQIDIEYDQQIGQNLFDDILYLDGAIGKSDIIDAAFAPALLKMAFYKDATTLSVQVIDLRNELEASNYIAAHHSNQNHIYICAVQGIVDPFGNTVFGVTVSNASGEKLGILLNYTEHSSVSEPFSGANLEGFTEQILTKTVIHELGHYLGISGHEGHTLGNIYCLMYLGYYPETFYQKRRSLYTNPHFCEDHINFLKNNN